MSQALILSQVLAPLDGQRQRPVLEAVIAIELAHYPAKLLADPGGRVIIKQGFGWEQAVEHRVSGGARGEGLLQQEGLRHATVAAMIAAVKSPLVVK